MTETYDIDLHNNNMTFHIVIKRFRDNFVKIEFTEHDDLFIDIYLDEVYKCTIAKACDLSFIDDIYFDDLNIYMYLLNAKKFYSDRITISSYSKEITLIGDLHCHTLSSGDGVYSKAEIIRKAKKLNLDFIAITDHNSSSSTFEKSNFLVLDGIELTTKYGHCNFLGLKHIINDLSVKNVTDLNRIMQIAMDKGGYITMNHPFSPKSRSFILEDKYISPCFIEIVNGPWGIHNRIAFEWWLKKLKNGIHYSIVGGSDFHFETEGKNLNIPFNKVKVKQKNQKAILESLMEGKNEIFLEDVNITSCVKDNMLIIKTSKCSTNYYLYVYSENETLEFNIKFHENISLDVKNKRFIVVALCDSNKRERNYVYITNTLKWRENERYC